MSQGSPEKQNISVISSSVDIERDFKELAPMVVEAGKSEICRAGRPTGDSSKSSCCSLESEIHRAAS